MKPSAVSDRLMRHKGRTVVFETIEDYHARIDDPQLDIDENCVIILKNVGPCLLVSDRTIPADARIHIEIQRTGTGIVPPDDFTLESGDRIQISIDFIGTLSNYVE